MVDLGGGTFDVAIVEYGEGVCEIIAVAGDNDLGGVDYDDVLAAEAQRRMLAQFPLSTVSDPLHRTLTAEAQRTKHRLTTEESAAFIVELEHEERLVTFDWEVTRSDFRALTEHLDRRVRAVVEDVIADSWHHGGIDTIFLTGQGTKIFTIAEILMSLGLTDDIVNTYREDAVARGLATYTNLLGGRSDKVPLLLGLSHRGIGLRLAIGGDKSLLMARKGSADDDHTVMLIERLTTIPTCRSEIFTFEGDAAADVPFTLIERSRSPTTTYRLA
ncbi:MAG: Hsp70 family protein [Pseudonocardiaceae bacterium]